MFSGQCFAVFCDVHRSQAFIAFLIIVKLVVDLVTSIFFGFKHFDSIFSQNRKTAIVNQFSA